MRKCPFCGENHLLEWFEVKYEDKPSRYVIRCLTCKARGPVADSRTEAEDLWNNRK